MFFSSSCRETAKTAMKQNRNEKTTETLFLGKRFSTWSSPKIGWFGGFSVKGVQKHHTHIFAKISCRKVPKQIDNDFEMSVFPRPFFLVLSRFWLFLSDGSSKAPQETFCQKIAKGVYKILSNLFSVAPWLLILNSGFSATTSRRCRPRAAEQNKENPKYVGLRTYFIRILF
jgi:hypothetical protein